MQSPKLMGLVEFSVVYFTRTSVYVSHNVDDDGQRPTKYTLLYFFFIFLKDRVYLFPGSLFTPESQ